MINPDTRELDPECYIFIKLTAGKHGANGKKLHPPCPSLGFTATGTKATHAGVSRVQCHHRLKAANQWPVITTADRIFSLGHLR